MRVAQAAAVRLPDVDGHVMLHASLSGVGGTGFSVQSHAAR